MYFGSSVKHVTHANSVFFLKQLMLDALFAFFLRKKNTHFPKCEKKKFVQALKVGNLVDYFFFTTNT